MSIRIGKLGIVRLTGKDMQALWEAMWERDKGCCQKCGRLLYRFDDGPLVAEMAYIQARGAGGSDTLENIRLLCRGCYRKEHVEGRSA